MKTGVTDIIKNVGRAARKHSPEILTGIGIAGWFTTTILVAKATPKAIALVEEMKEDKMENEEECKPIDVVKAGWKPYIPAVITGAASTACLIGASSVSAKRHAALTAAYEISRTALVEYKDAVVETVGEKKAQQVNDAVAKKHVEENQPIEQNVILTERGNTLCYDVISGRYFKSDKGRIQQSINELNKNLLEENYISLNDFYYALGLPCNKLGNELGWNSNDGLIDLTFSSQLTEDGTPCLVVDYHVAPRYNYADFGY